MLSNQAPFGHHLSDEPSYAVTSSRCLWMSTVSGRKRYMQLYLFQLWYEPAGPRTQVWKFLHHISLSPQQQAHAPASDSKTAATFVNRVHSTDGPQFPVHSIVVAASL